MEEHAAPSRGRCIGGSEVKRGRGFSHYSGRPFTNNEASDLVNRKGN